MEISNLIFDIRLLIFLLTLFINKVCGPAPTELKNHDYSIFRLIFVGASPRGRPKFFKMRIAENGAMNLTFLAFGGIM